MALQNFINCILSAARQGALTRGEADILIRRANELSERGLSSAEVKASMVADMEAYTARLNGRVRDRLIAEGLTPEAADVRFGELQTAARDLGPLRRSLQELGEIRRDPEALRALARLGEAFTGAKGTPDKTLDLSHRDASQMIRAFVKGAKAPNGLRAPSRATQLPASTGTLG